MGRWFWDLSLSLAICLAGAAPAAAEDTVSPSSYWFNWGVHLAPFPSTWRYKDDAILQRKDLFGLGTRFEFVYLPRSTRDLALMLGLDGGVTVHFLQDAVTDRPGFEYHTTMFDVATYDLSSDLAISYGWRLSDGLKLNPMASLGIIDINTPRSALGPDGPYWSGQNNWVLGNMGAGFEAEITARLIIGYNYSYRRPVPHMAGMRIRLGQQDRSYSSLKFGGSVDGRISYIYIGYEKSRLWASGL